MQPMIPSEGFSRTFVLRFCVCVAIGASAWIIPSPEGLSVPGWHVLGVFAATIAGFLMRPLPMGAMVLLGLVALCVTDTLAYNDILIGFGDSTVWLVVAAFLIAGAVGRTGFGRRIALSLVRLLGRSTIGLGYAVCGGELILAPFVPSNTARGGGIMAPIVLGLADALDSHPSDGPERAGRYLVLTGAQANLITAAMFLTAMAANPLVVRSAAEIFGVEFGWGRWALGALVPGLLALGLLPLLIYRLAPPTIPDATIAQQQARAELASMGRWTRGQKTMAATFLLLLALWSTKPLHGLGAGLVAWIGVCVLLVSGTERWERITGNASAWDTLFWLGGLLAMVGALKSQGVVDWFAGSMQGSVEGLGSVAIVVVLGLIYFYSMYGFSMLTAHITALLAAFFTVAYAAGAPPMITIALLAYLSSLCGCTTNYSTPPVVVYFGFRYVPPGAWFKVGALISLFHLVVWIAAGMAWWRILGWW